MGRNAQTTNPCFKGEVVNSRVGVGLGVREDSGPHLPLSQSPQELYPALIDWCK